MQTGPGGYPPQQQPYTSYPQQPQPYSQPPVQPPFQQYQPPFQLPQSPPPPKKKRRIWLWVIGAILVIGAIANAGSHSSSNTDSPATGVATTQQQSQSTQAPEATPTPTKALKWTVTQTFSGTGSKKTGVFTVSDNWAIAWACNPASYDIPYNVIIEVYNADGSPLDLTAVETTCKTGNTQDTTHEPTGGSVYLDITSEGDWAITVQELK